MSASMSSYNSTLPTDWSWETLVLMALFLSQTKAELTFPCPLTKAGDCKQSQHSPAPGLKLMHMHRQGTLLLHF